MTESVIVFPAAHSDSLIVRLFASISLNRTSLVTWLISNILLCFILSRGMLMLTLTGGLMIIASLVYHFMQPSIPLAIPFSDGFLRFHYGWCFWLCVSAGTSLILSLICRYDSFIHAGYFYSASSSPLLLRIAPDTTRIVG